MLIRGWPWQGVVPPFAADGVGALEQATVDHDPAADSGAEDRAVVFRKAVATAPWTLPSHASMFTGLEAMRHGVNHYGAVPSSFELVAETMRQAGYVTAAVTGGGYLRPQFGFAQGFDSFVYWPHEDSKAELATGLATAEEWLDLSQWFRNLVAGITAPVFQGGRLRANVQAARARLLQQNAAYGRAVLTAVVEADKLSITGACCAEICPAAPSSKQPQRQRAIR